MCERVGYTLQPKRQNNNSQPPSNQGKDSRAASGAGPNTIAPLTAGPLPAAPVRAEIPRYQAPNVQVQTGPPRPSFTGQQQSQRGQVFDPKSSDNAFGNGNRKYDKSQGFLCIRCGDLGHKAVNGVPCPKPDLSRDEQTILKGVVFGCRPYAPYGQGQASGSNSIPVRHNNVEVESESDSETMCDLDLLTPQFSDDDTKHVTCKNHSNSFFFENEDGTQEKVDFRTHLADKVSDVHPAIRTERGGATERFDPLRGAELPQQERQDRIRRLMGIHNFLNHDDPTAVGPDPPPGFEQSYPSTPKKKKRSKRELQPIQYVVENGPTDTKQITKGI